ncbi:response regulator transcription factor [Vibrio sp. Isolate23]|uniref:response regulator n=1 Tax=Vibrio sp. Isolate23 TaxID=2908533 RepID=UPI001EFE6BD1|nr:response regulator transcription factor [Vibrio sp. Isolate23]
MASVASKIKIAILDDHELVLQGIKSYLTNEESFTILGTYTKSSELLKSFTHNLPDVLVADYELTPDENDGANLVRSIHAKFPSIKIIVMSSHFNTGIVSLALRAGAKGFVGKHQSQEELIKAVKMVCKGKLYLERNMAEQISENRGVSLSLNNGSSHTSLQMTPLIKQGELTTREREVVRCLISGMTVSEIAAKFSRSIKTISTQKVNAMKKLGVSSDKELYQIEFKEIDRQE